MRGSLSLFASILILTIFIPTSFAQYDPDGLFQFSRYWQIELNETDFIEFNFVEDTVIDEKDLFKLIEGWQSDLPTATPIVTDTTTPTATSTSTFTPSLTHTPTETSTFTPTRTPTSVPTNTSTQTPTSTFTRTVTPTPTMTLTPTATFTVTETSTPTSTPTLTPTQTPDSMITINLPGDVTMELVHIPAGSFNMGSNYDTSWSLCIRCEKPIHEVTIGYDFYMGRLRLPRRSG